MRDLSKVFIILSIVLSVTACADFTPAAVPAKETNAPRNAVHWAYEGEEGPDHWGELSPEYTTCGTGTNQSPIDISITDEKDLVNIAFHYQPSEVNILNNGHTVQVNYDPGSYIELDGIRYDVVQFHYHAPSEHEINGKRMAAEIHLVHKSADGKLAVVGLLLEEGAENAALSPFINNLPPEKSDVKDVNQQINAADLLPDIQTTFRYSGSLTTPPCTEGVNWLVMTTPIELSSEQLSKLENVFGTNNRPVQPLNDRSLLEDITP